MSATRTDTRPTPWQERGFASAFCGCGSGRGRNKDSIYITASASDPGVVSMDDDMDGRR